MSFTLCNNNSINLNFMIYIVKLYEDKEVDLNNVFLSKEELNSQIKYLWNNMVLGFKPIIGKYGNSSFINWDRQLLKEKDNYKVLFKNTKEGYKQYLKAWENYFNWWYKEEEFKLNEKMDEIIPSIYNNVKDKLKKNKLQLPEESFCIQVIFDKVPSGCLTSGTLFTIEAIDNFSDEQKIYKISERLYDVILNSYV